MVRALCLPDNLGNRHLIKPLNTVLTDNKWMNVIFAYSFEFVLIRSEVHLFNGTMVKIHSDLQFTFSVIQQLKK